MTIFGPQITTEPQIITTKSKQSTYLHTGHKKKGANNLNDR